MRRLFLLVFTRFDLNVFEMSIVFSSLFRVNEFLGCMSFGIRHLTNPKKEVSGWYYLLTEDIGRKKHLQVSQRLKPQLRVRNTGKSQVFCIICIKINLRVNRLVTVWSDSMK